MDGDHRAGLVSVCDAVRALIKTADFENGLCVDGFPDVIIVCKRPHFPAQPAQSGKR